MLVGKNGFVASGATVKRRSAAAKSHAHVASHSAKSQIIIPAGARLSPRVAPTPSISEPSNLTAHVASVERAAGNPQLSDTPAQAFDPHHAPYIYFQGQRVHSLHAYGMDVLQSMGAWAEKDLMRFLKPVEKCWQPTDFLPDSSSPDFEDQVRALRETSKNLPLEYLVVLVGDMVTEEALPSYMNMINLLDGAKVCARAMQQRQPQARKQGGCCCAPPMHLPGPSCKQARSSPMSAPAQPPTTALGG